ncbi:hypothetical protein P154DRAFT_222842 [Amniculicola lignicola CBS 123094]|uniref:Uncharacterized protein n=1 Tax=Amniculicola lignicola CBS 123094 TaxID=1392246 RepID=A0A6A5WYD1_9PLEO|nr:hypothetical protein P154DRAFT_222842 [Amniculicola lignicola CBS 123094]
MGVGVEVWKRRRTPQRHAISICICQVGYPASYNPAYVSFLCGLSEEQTLGWHSWLVRQIFTTTTTAMTSMVSYIRGIALDISLIGRNSRCIPPRRNDPDLDLVFLFLFRFDLIGLLLLLGTILKSLIWWLGDFGWRREIRFLFGICMDWVGLDGWFGDGTG